MDKHLWEEEGREDRQEEAKRKSPLGNGSAKATDSGGNRCVERAGMEVERG